MWALFSYDLAVGKEPTVDVRVRLLQRFETMPDGSARDKCELLDDTLMCVVEDFDDFNRLNNGLAALRNQLGQQFNYSFTLHRRNDTLAVRGPHDTAAKERIRTFGP